MADTLAVPEDRGSTTIADRVVERIASMAAGEVERVVDTRSGLTRLVRGGLPQADAVVAGGTSRIAVSVAASWPTPVAVLAARVRDHVNERVATLTGIDVVAVDVRVADVVHVSSAEPRVT